MKGGNGNEKNIPLEPRSGSILIAVGFTTPGSVKRTELRIRRQANYRPEAYIKKNEAKNLHGWRIISAIQKGFRLRQFVMNTSQRFGSPLANCVIPLPMVASLPPFNSFFFSRTSTRQPRESAAPRSTVPERQNRVPVPAEWDHRKDRSGTDRRLLRRPV